MTAIASLLSNTAAMPVPPAGAPATTFAAFPALLAPDLLAPALTPAADGSVPAGRQTGAGSGKPLPQQPERDEDALAWLEVGVQPSLALMAPVDMPAPGADATAPIATAAAVAPSPAMSGEMRPGIGLPSPVEPFVAPPAMPMPGEDATAPLPAAALPPRAFAGAVRPGTGLPSPVEPSVAPPAMPMPGEDATAPHAAAVLPSRAFAGAVRPGTGLPSPVEPSVAPPATPMPGEDATAAAAALPSRAFAGAVRPGTGLPSPVEPSVAPAAMPMPGEDGTAAPVAAAAVTRSRGAVEGASPGSIKDGATGLRRAGRRMDGSMPLRFVSARPVEPAVAGAASPMSAPVVAPVPATPFAAAPAQLAPVAPAVSATVDPSVPSDQVFGGDDGSGRSAATAVPAPGGEALTNVVAATPSGIPRATAAIVPTAAANGNPADRHPARDAAPARAIAPSGSSPRTDAPAVTTGSPATNAAAPAARVFAEAIHRALGERERRQPAEPAPVALTPATPIGSVAAAGAAQQGALDMRQEHWPQAMIDRIVTLRDMAAENDTRLRLSPDMLGSIEVSLKRDGDAVQVQITAEQPQTRQLLADAQPRLTELADQRGVKLQLAGGQTGTGTQAGGGDAPRQHAASTPAAFARRQTAAHDEAAPSDQRIA